jgi:lipopolysaccharide heptosyltransferase I
VSKLDANSDTLRVLIVRLSAIGDVIHGLPVLSALRDRFPQAFLGWVVEGRASSLLRGHPALDELITLPCGWLKSPATVWQLRRRLRALQFDVAIDVQGLTKSAVAAWLSGARRRIGFGDEKGRELSPWFANEKVQTTAAHIIDCNLELLRPLGITSPPVRFDLPEHADDRQSAQTMIGEAGLSDGFAMMTPGAGWSSKLWPPERFAAVAVYLGRGWGLSTMVVWAGDEEHRRARQIVAGSRGHARLAPPTSLTELAALARRARLFVGSDTGPVHLAAAVGTPCVGLYGPMPAERNGPYGAQHIAVEQMRFEGTSRQRRTASREVIESIQVDHVCAACAEILRRKVLNVA